MFFGAFLGPIFAILLFNVVIFVIIITVLIKHSRKKLGREVDKGKHKTIIRLMCSITGVMSIFGLAWVFGALTVVSRSFAFQVLFALFNSLQGFMIFLFFCVISKESRELWTQFLCRGKLAGSSAPSSKAGKSHKQSVGTSSRSSTFNTGVRSRTSSLLPSGREREASLSIVKANPVAHELSILEEESEEEVQQHRKNETSLLHSSPDQSNESGIVMDELQSETSLLAVETIFFESDPTMQVQESSMYDEGQIDLIDFGSSDEQGSADGVADATIDGNADEVSDVILEVVINQHAEDD